jgi:transcription-repair coupling factor (superfamily II helicase)
MSISRNPADALVAGRPLTLMGVADGVQGLVVADLARALAARQAAGAVSLVVVCRDGPRLAALGRALGFFAPDLTVLEFPAWDCLPYDRVSPHAGVVAQRMTALSRLARAQGRERPSVLLTSVNAVLQRVPARGFVARQALSIAPGNVLAMAGITAWLERNGFLRAPTVREPGEYAVRGGILDLYAPGTAAPVRLDFFGDTLETIRSFDPESQRTTRQLRDLDLVPVAEFQLVTDTIKRFRLGYVEAFGAPAPDDLLYHAVSDGRRHPGMEHWLPLFHEQLETLLDYVPGSAVALEPLVEDAARERLAQINDYYDARQQALAQRGSGPPYKPLPPARLYLEEAEWRERINRVPLARLTPFSLPEGQGPAIDVGARQGHNFAAERAQPGGNVFEAVTRYVTTLQTAGKRVIIALWSEGSRERMSHVLADHGLANLSPAASWQDAMTLPKPQVALAVLGLESGFETSGEVIISEQDILGDRLVRPRRASRRAENFIAEATSLAAGDLVVHVDHGIGVFAGLRQIGVGDAMQEFLRRATSRKIDRLSELITESFRYLLRKKTLVNRLAIDPEKFAITLYDNDGHAIAKQRLSEGEKQIFAISVLWGLARASNTQPVIVVRFEARTGARLEEIQQFQDVVRSANEPMVLLEESPAELLDIAQHTFERPDRFRDSMVRGPLARLDHDHEFEDDGAGGTLMRDVFDYAAPLGLLGRLAERLFLTRHLRRFLAARNAELKRIAESDEWRRYLP